MRRIKTALVVGLGAALAAASAAWAGDDQGSAVIHAVELARSSVVLDGQAYRVTDHTELRDEEGNELTLAELPSLEAGADTDAAAVWFEAAEAGSDRDPRPLLLLKLTGGLPK